MSIGCRIRKERQAHQLSQQALAVKLGVSREAISQWETGDTKGLKPENLVRTARAFGVTVEWLVFGTEPKHPQVCNKGAQPTGAQGIAPLNGLPPGPPEYRAAYFVTLYQRMPEQDQTFVRNLLTRLCAGPETC